MNNSDMPAMPQSVSHSSYDGQLTASYDFDGGQGLTKREHFAAMAMQGILSSSANPTWEKGDIAHSAIEYADALLEALG